MTSCLIFGKNNSESDDKNNEHLKRMKEKLNSKLSKENEMFLNFALGKAYEDCNDFATSFVHYKKANDIKNTKIDFNINNEKKKFQNLKNLFLNSSSQIQENTNSSSKTIIFVLGMPRSGTSLIEQIISSHPDVYGSGELEYLERLMVNNFYTNNELKIPNLETENNQELVDQISSKYYELIEDFNSNQKNITDKAPLNFRWVGFIKILFPDAKIIHSVRDPKDNCLSLYKNIFDDSLNWTYDKSHLFHYYKNYVDLMNFWKKKLPNFIYDCKYEDLIGNSKIEIEKLLTFCDLDWHDNCLKFYDTKRAIKTVSVAQARQPLYKSSISSSKKFEPFLSDLFTNLDNLFR